MISATLPHEILEMTSKFMTEPVRILVKRDELTLEVPMLVLLLSIWCPFGNYIFICYVFRASNNSLLLLRKRNGNLILCVIFMIH